LVIAAISSTQASSFSFVVGTVVWLTRLLLVLKFGRCRLSRKRRPDRVSLR
jgi:hypothetical protein